MPQRSADNGGTIPTERNIALYCTIDIHLQNTRLTRIVYQQYFRFIIV